MNILNIPLARLEKAIGLKRTLEEKQVQLSKLLSGDGRSLPRSKETRKKISEDIKRAWANRKASAA